ncbi:MAG: hypothetical protein NBV68_02250 [Erythrobacter sp.]|uniref:hypothetical protein n=1 Tax=Erythrobacter sp. TaxID=1042 RepID=UPI0025E5267A|nr:hypothetical protein [Erythrobacter sp.]MCL9998178.1 hypothetical protein [Erythrobacter sp.]
MLFKLALFAVATSVAATPGDGRQPPPSDDFVGGLCAAVESKVLENAPSYNQVTYLYQQFIAEASGVQFTDSSEQYNSKIATWLNANMPTLLCNTSNFNPRNGNILKLAVARQNNSFINDAILNWKIDLNQIDATDGKTVLDYIEDRKASSGTTSAFGKTLQRYWEKFRAAGAKRASELH